jgi:integrase
VPAFRLHDLRHTIATLLFARGAKGTHRNVMHEWLGHANLATTLDFKIHVTTDMRRHAADALEAAIAELGERIA